MGLWAWCRCQRQRHNNQCTSVSDGGRLALHCFNPASRPLYLWRGCIPRPFVVHSPDSSPRTDLLTAWTAGLFSGSTKVEEDYTTLLGVPPMPHIPDSPVAEASLSSVSWAWSCDSKHVYCQMSADTLSEGCVYRSKLLKFQRTFKVI